MQRYSGDASHRGHDKVTTHASDTGATVNRVGLVVHGGRPEALEAADVVRAWCEEHTVRCADIDVWNEGGLAAPPAKRWTRQATRTSS